MTGRLALFFPEIKSELVVKASILLVENVSGLFLVTSGQN